MRSSKVPFLLRCVQLQIQTMTAGQQLTHWVQPRLDNQIETASTQVLVKIVTHGELHPIWDGGPNKGDLD